MVLKQAVNPPRRQGFGKNPVNRGAEFGKDDTLREGVFSMAGIIKGGMNYGYPPPWAEQQPSMMKTIYGSKPVQLTPEEQKKEEKSVEPKKSEPEKQIVTEEFTATEEEFDSTEYIREEDAKIERQLLVEEYEQLRLRYEKESEAYIMRAKEKASEIYDKTKDIANKTVNEAKAEASDIRKSAYDEGNREGYDDGYKAGYDEGYVNALKKCKDTLVELKEIAESVGMRKSELFLNYEHALFDVIFEIAQKVTLNSLKQKDKAVITKMLREAGKHLRGSKNVRITLSKLDVAEEAEIDNELIEELSKGGTNVEFEILGDAPSGTLIIDNGAGITDAGVMTQLQMIENLGRGKYRDKSFTDMLKEQQLKKDASAEEEASQEAVAEEETPDIMNMVRKKAAQRRKPAAKKKAAEEPEVNGDEE